MSNENTNERAHALVLAETLMNISNGRSPQSESFNAAAATELQTLHFRVKELEAMLDAVGAGGVSAQRVTQSPTLKASSDWLIDGGLLYRLNDRGTNCDEINVTMAGNSRRAATRAERAEEILNMLKAVQQAEDHIEQPLEMVAAPVVLPEPFALYDGEKWYANEEAAICACANTQKLQKVYTEQQVRSLLAAHGITQEKHSNDKEEQQWQ